MLRKRLCEIKTLQSERNYFLTLYVKAVLKILLHGITLFMPFLLRYFLKISLTIIIVIDEIVYWQKKVH